MSPIECLFHDSQSVVRVISRVYEALLPFLSIPESLRSITTWERDLGAEFQYVEGPMWQWCWKKYSRLYSPWENGPAFSITIAYNIKFVRMCDSIHATRNLWAQTGWYKGVQDLITSHSTNTYRIHTYIYTYIRQVYSRYNLWVYNYTKLDLCTPEILLKLS